MKNNLFSFTFWLVVIFQVTAPMNIWAQEKGKAVIYFSPPSAIIRLDTTLIQSRQSPKLLPVGKHIIKAWAPTFQLFIDTILISQTGIKIEAKELKHTPEYELYRAAKFKYRLLMVLERYSSAPLIIAYVAYYSNRNTQYKNDITNSYNQALSEKTRYDHALSLKDITAYRDAYLYYQGNYQAAQRSKSRLNTISVVAIPVSTVCSMLLFLRSTKLIRPHYSESPLLSLQSVSFNKCEANAFSIGTHFILNL